MFRRVVLLAGLSVFAMSSALASDGVGISGGWAVSANDGHSVTNPAGALVMSPAPVADNIQLLKFSNGSISAGPMLPVPVSIAGPPDSVWISPDGLWGVVTAGAVVQKAAVASQTSIKVSDIVSVFLRESENGAVILHQTTHAGPGAASVAVSPDQRWVVVANRGADSLSVFQVTDHRLELKRTIGLGQKSNPASLKFTPDGKQLLVVLRGYKSIAVIPVDGEGPQNILTETSVGHSPNTMDISENGALIAVGDMDKAHAATHILTLQDNNVVPLYDIPAGPGPEPIHFSADGALLAVGAVQGSNQDPTRRGSLTVYRISARSAMEEGRINVGRWPQGVIFSADDKSILIQNAGDHNITVLNYSASAPHLSLKQTINVAGSPSSIASSW